MVRAIILKSYRFFYDKLVKNKNLGWLSKKLHMRGAYFFFDFGVLRYVVIKQKM